MSTPKSIAVIIAYGLLVIVAGVLLWQIVHRLFFLPAENAERKARGIVHEETIDATGQAASEGMEIVREIHIEHRRIDDITRSNEHAIKTTPGADSRAPAVAGALKRGLCQSSYHGDAGCAAVLGDGDGLGPAGSDAARPAAR